MKTKILLLTIAMMVTVALSAQNRGAKTTPEQRAKARIEAMSKDMQLTDAQKAKIEKEIISMQTEMQKIRSEGNREKMAELRKELDAKIGGIVGEKKYKEYLEKNGQNGRGNANGRSNDNDRNGDRNDNRRGGERNNRR